MCPNRDVTQSCLLRNYSFYFHLFPRPSVALTTACLPVCLSAFLSALLSAFLSAILSVCLSVCLSFCRFCLSAYVCVYVCVTYSTVNSYCLSPSLPLSLSLPPTSSFSPPPLPSLLPPPISDGIHCSSELCVIYVNHSAHSPLSEWGGWGVRGEVEGASVARVICNG